MDYRQKAAAPPVRCGSQRTSGKRETGSGWGWQLHDYAFVWLLVKFLWPHPQLPGAPFLAGFVSICGKVICAQRIGEIRLMKWRVKFAKGLPSPGQAQKPSSLLQHTHTQKRRSTNKASREIANHMLFILFTCGKYRQIVSLKQLQLNSALSCDCTAPPSPSASPFFANYAVALLPFVDLHTHTHESRFRFPFSFPFQCVREATSICQLTIGNRLRQLATGWGSLQHRQHNHLS